MTYSVVNLQSPEQPTFVDMIDTLGQVAGYDTTDSNQPGGNPVLWSLSGSLAVSDLFDWPEAINASGETIGASGTTGLPITETASGVRVTLDDPTGQGDYSAAAINNKGGVAGASWTTSGQWAAAYWDPQGESTLLATPTGYGSSVYTINNAGDLEDTSIPGTSTAAQPQLCGQTREAFFGKVLATTAKSAQLTPVENRSVVIPVTPCIGLPQAWKRY
jgi:hypothetical protein